MHNQLTWNNTFPLRFIHFINLIILLAALQLFLMFMWFYLHDFKWESKCWSKATDSLTPSQKSRKQREPGRQLHSQTSSKNHLLCSSWLACTQSFPALFPSKYFCSMACLKGFYIWGILGKFPCTKRRYLYIFYRYPLKTVLRSMVFVSNSCTSVYK